MFYQWLIDNIPVGKLPSKESNEIKGIIESIRDDELRHNQMYKNMYIFLYI